MLRARVAVSCRPRFSIFRNASRISGALISPIGRLPNSLSAKSRSQRFFFQCGRGIAFRLEFVHELFGHGFERIGPRDPRIAALFLAVDGGIDPSARSFLALSRLIRASARELAG